MRGVPLEIGDKDKWQDDRWNILTLKLVINVIGIELSTRSQIERSIMGNRVHDGAINPPGMDINEFMSLHATISLFQGVLTFIESARNYTVALNWKLCKCIR